MDKLQFRISTGLKNIIGKELITNQYVAIFELVKNSYDAYAERVDVYFEEDKIIIQDDGKGMSLDDIKNKWLFVWYSAKADETEDERYGDYRKKINIRKGFAGAKGIGRFACDALGSEMKLITKSEEPNSSIEQLFIDWTQFESDKKNEFQSVDAIHETLSSFKDIPRHWTRIEISWLLHHWNKEEIEKLKTHLAKLISPFKGTQDDNFEIVFHIGWDEQKVGNFVFQKLWVRTVHINTSIDESWNFISSILSDRWEKIYSIQEENNSLLKSININLFFLNLPAKAYFTKQIKVQPVNFGSILVFKNWFRVFPYGEPREDSFGLDARKTQWYARYLWTRDLIGSIEIDDKDNIFKEVSNREGWFINTLEYIQLKELLFNVIRKLENYTRDIVSWTYDLQEWKDITPFQKKEEIKLFLEKLSNSKKIINFDFKANTQNFINEKIRSNSYESAKKTIEKSVKEKDSRDVANALKTIEEWKKNSDEENRELKKKLEIEKQRATALELDIKTTKNENILSYYHDIFVFSQNIDWYSKQWLESIKSKNYEELEDIFDAILFENEKIYWISKVALKRWFKENAQIQKRDLVKMVEEYSREYSNINQSIQINIQNNFKWKFNIPFRYYDFVRVLDNLFQNSEKHQADNITLQIEWQNDLFELRIIDDGKWLDDKFLWTPEKIFEPRVSTTKWAWYWLSQVKNVIDELNWTINIQVLKKGLAFIITIKKWE